MLEQEELPYKKPAQKKTPKKGENSCPETDNGRHLYEWFLSDRYPERTWSTYTLVKRCIGCGGKAGKNSFKFGRKGQDIEYYGLLSELEG